MAINQWARIAKKNKTRMLSVAKKTTLIMGKRIIKISPVDTSLFKQTWNTAINMPDLSIDASAGAGLIPVTSQLKLGDVIYFTNNQPYARRLEFGWSSQAPLGMVRLTVANFQGIVDREAKKVMNKKI